jgi:hypothetical protein
MGRGLDRKTERDYNAFIEHNIAKSGEDHEKAG